MRALEYALATCIGVAVCLILISVTAPEKEEDTYRRVAREHFDTSRALLDSIDPRTKNIGIHLERSKRHYEIGRQYLYKADSVRNAKKRDNE